MTDEFNVLIENVIIVDGINKVHEGAIGIKGERVSAVGDISGDAKKVVDATGLTAMPGFVDSHSHIDWGLHFFRDAKCAVMQGCTTAVGGNCGGSPAPLNEYINSERDLRQGLVDEIYEHSPYLYYQPFLLPIDAVNDLLRKKYGWTIDYRTMGEYFKHIEEKGISINYVPQVGHGTVRWAVMGKDYKRHTTNTELAQMKDLIHQAMEEGCRGISAGLDYDPGIFAASSEINECVAVLKEYNGIYTPHWRRTGRRRGRAGTKYIEPIKGIIEVIDTCRKTGVRLNIAHLMSGWHTTPPMTPEIGKEIGEATIAPIDKAIDEGLEVSFDLIPYPRWHPMPYLCSSHFPQWLRLLGSREKLAEWLKVDEFRKKALEEIESGKLYASILPHWDESIKITKHKNIEYTGKTLAQVAEKIEKDPWNTLCDLIVEDPNSMGSRMPLPGNEEVFKVFIKHPAGVIGLDTMFMDKNWEQKTPPYASYEPDHLSGYPKFLIRYVRDSNFFTLEEAVHKCATLPAKIHRIKDRGVINVGAYADIVLIDFQNLKIVGPPEESRDYPEGIKYVFVNGTTVVDEGKHTGTRPGKILKRE